MVKTLLCLFVFIIISLASENDSIDSLETYLGWLEGILSWDFNINFKGTSLVTSIFL
jgi:ABC-type antimicrobial peptide transport system permease subunit